MKTLDPVPPPLRDLAVVRALTDRIAVVEAERDEALARVVELEAGR